MTGAAAWQKVAGEMVPLTCPSLTRKQCLRCPHRGITLIVVRSDNAVEGWCCMKCARRDGWPFLSAQKRKVT
jgi:hypothetical protein